MSSLRSRLELVVADEIVPKLPAYLGIWGLSPWLLPNGKIMGWTYTNHKKRQQTFKNFKSFIYDKSGFWYLSGKSTVGTAVSRGNMKLGQTGHHDILVFVPQFGARSIRLWVGTSWSSFHFTDFESCEMIGDQCGGNITGSSYFVNLILWVTAKETRKKFCCNLLNEDGWGGSSSATSPCPGNFWHISSFLFLLPSSPADIFHPIFMMCSVRGRWGLEGEEMSHATSLTGSKSMSCAGSFLQIVLLFKV